MMCATASLTGLGEGRTSVIGDGALYCRDCALEPCPACKGEEVRPLESPVVVDGRKFNLTWGSCSCCGAGASDTTTSDDPTWTWAVVDAALADRDGVAYARLCYGNGDGGCLHEVLEQQAEVREETRDALNIMRSLSPGDVDAAVADVKSLGLAIEP